MSVILTFSQEVEDFFDPKDDVGFRVRALIDEAMTSDDRKTALKQIFERVRNGKGSSVDLRAAEIVAEVFFDVHRVLVKNSQTDSAHVVLDLR